MVLGKFQSSLASFGVLLEPLLEVLCVFHFLSLFILGNLVAVPLIFILLPTSLSFLIIVYFLWMFYDLKTPRETSRGWQFLRRLFIWRFLASYFPIKLHKTCELDPKENYMFGYHPHGIFALSAFVNFASDATDCSKKFPGITFHTLTLDLNFRMPVFREYVLLMGLGSVHKDSINYKLTKMGEGHSVVIVTGGAAEAHIADPNNPYVLKLKNRNGFVREALRAGYVLFCYNFLFIY